MARILRVAVLAALWTVWATAPALAQFPPERIFDLYDRDRDGELDREEMERVRQPLRERLERSGGRSVDRDEFARLFEEQRGRDGGDRNRDDRDGGSRNSSSTGRTTPKLRERVTLELPSKYTEGDHDGDGQLGLHEWIQWKSRAAIGEFLARDINRDGFLTPRELTIAEKANGVGSVSGTSGRSTSGGVTGASRSTSPGAPPAGPGPSGPAKQLDEATARIAREAFGNLDRDGDGRLSDEEWRNSQATRLRFEDAGVRLPTPADLDAFLQLYPLEERDQEVSRDDGESRGNSNGGGEERSRGRGFFGRGR